MTTSQNPMIIWDSFLIDIWGNYACLEGWSYDGDLSDSQVLDLAENALNQRKGLAFYPMSHVRVTDGGHRMVEGFMFEYRYRCRGPTIKYGGSFEITMEENG